MIPALEVFPSHTNFILIRHEKAEQLKNYLESVDIGVRYFSPSAQGLKNCLRISMGTREENDEVFKVTSDWLI